MDEWNLRPHRFGVMNPARLDELARCRNGDRSFQSDYLVRHRNINVCRGIPAQNLASEFSSGGFKT